MLFCTFFTCSPKHPNGNISVDIESFRPCLSKPSYRAPKWALMVRLMQKERLKSPQKSQIIENQASWVILAIFGRNFHLGHDFQPFPSQGGHADKKSQLGSCLRVTRQKRHMLINYIDWSTRSDRQRWWWYRTELPVGPFERAWSQVFRIVLVGFSRFCSEKGVT